jgi:hypothetical protein
MACTSEEIIAFLECIRDNRLPLDTGYHLEKWFPRVHDVVGAIVYNTSNGRQIYDDFCASSTRVSFPEMEEVIRRAGESSLDQSFLNKCLFYLYAFVHF